MITPTDDPSLTGFTTVRREGLELNAGVTLPLSAELKVGSIEETITVTGASPVVDTQNVRSQNVLTREVLDSVPNAKTSSSLAALTLSVMLLDTSLQAAHEALDLTGGVHNALLARKERMAVRTHLGVDFLDSGPDVEGVAARTNHLRFREPLGMNRWLHGVARSASTLT